MSLDPQVLQSLSKDDLKSLLSQLAVEDAGLFTAFLKENSDARRAAKAAIGSGGRTRAPSFLTDTLEQGMIAMAGALEAEVVEGDDVATCSNVLKVIVEKIREKKDGAGTQEAYTLSYEEDGISHKVRVTFLSETAAADSVLAKSLEAINKAGEENFGSLVDKWRKSIKRQRVDATVRTEHLEAFDDAVAKRKSTLTGDDNGAASAAPPAPPA